MFEVSCKNVLYKSTVIIIIIVIYNTWDWEHMIQVNFMHNILKQFVHIVAPGKGL